MAISLVLDCAAPQVLADFWAPALGYRRLGEAGQYLKLVPEEGQSGPALLLQQVDEPKTTKLRMHLDIHATDIEEEAQRLIQIGAVRVAGPITEHGTSWIVLTDPEGNELCVCDSPA